MALAAIGYILTPGGEFPITWGDIKAQYWSVGLLVSLGTKDARESIDVSEQQPEAIKMLLSLAEKAHEDLGDAGRAGRGRR